ncbi:hypothetical protein RHGRI_010308 [Rhododendron griersonianum]|uniref:Apyrase n=1 Tax=Rhododendron griersonianum TaxID=479676 RepID=A0AAV6KIR2_9ERIC|nr:hypothetical protein RHGRI_010308 [Rhododendron griersonianum]
MPPPPKRSSNNSNGGRQYYGESLSEKMRRLRKPVLVASTLVLLVCLLAFLCSSPSSDSVDSFANRKYAPGGSKSYVVIFDAGSSGSRVHVFCFDRNLDLVPIGEDLELFVQKKPGLSSYAKDPKDAASSLLSLLKRAKSVVPQELQQKTPVRVGATAGLRLLHGDASDQILQAVRDFLKDDSTFISKADWVTVLDGTQEGAYLWVTVNYLLGSLGKKYSDTVGVVDLGGGSVQMAYAISETDAANAPRISNGEDTYVKKMHLKGKNYYLYVHRFVSPLFYLNYGLLAARAEILKVGNSGSPCILVGYDGQYNYGGASYPASASSSGSSMEKCRGVATKILRVNEPTCTHMKCTFGGIWNGGGGDGQKNLFVASFFFDRAAEAGFVNPNQPVAKVRPMDFANEAKHACETSLKDAKSRYPRVEEDNLPYLCMDLVYEFTLLVDGFGLDPDQEITLVKRVEYQNSKVEAAWPLGSAIEAVSSLT